MKFDLIILACLVSTAAAMTTTNYQDCGDPSNYGPYGAISSPNHPGNYYDSISCDEFIYASTRSTLSLIFNSFNTEPCCDYVTIRCITNSSIPAQRFSGHSLPDPLSIQWCSQGLVNFQTDSSVVYNGFNLDYYVSDGGCGNTVYKDAFGFVTTPNYPNPYGVNQNCSNIIWAPQQSTFYLQFHAFSLETDCNRDWLEISCLDGAAFGPSRYCGYKPYTTMYIYGCSRLLLWFHSDGSGNTSYGFNIEYNVNLHRESTDFENTYPSTSTTRPAETDYTDSSLPPTSTVDQACGNSAYYDASGVIRSPNYPTFYYDFMNCDYFVYAPTGSSLSFIFKSFHVESPDFVTISCPSNPNFPTREYSGHFLPEPISIPLCTQARVSFRSDNSVVSTGFSIDYYVSDAGCEDTLFIGSNGFVSSPNYPGSYRSNQNCSNIIWAPQASTINLNFGFFNLEDDCKKDWLEVSCLDNSEYGPNRLCGSQGDYDLYIDQCSQVLLWFHSDATGNYQGFFIEYTIYSSTAAACGNTSFHDKTGIISSQNYPDNYANFLYCDYTIYAPAGSPILLIFESFNTQSTNDLVTITCPGNSNIPKREYSGTDLPTPISIPDCSQALINFRTDASVVSSGFSLKYYVSDAGCGNTVHLPSYGEVTSPNYPNYYEYNQDCANIIYGFGRSSFYLDFRYFILQSCCSCDWLEISCVDNSEYGPTRYCGSYNLTYDSMYIHNCSQVLLWFHSDDSGNDQGFSMWYNVYTTAGDKKEPRNSKPLASENVPIKAKPLASENVPIKAKPLASENVPIKGKTLASENVPNSGKPNAEESRKGK